MALFKDDPPTPPDPRLTSGLQTAENVNVALANAYLNNTNQVTPTGSLTYSQSGSHIFTDPATGVQYTIPSFTQTTALTPEEQQIQNLNAQARTNLGSLAAGQSARLGTLLGQDINLSDAPAAGNTGMLNVADAATEFGGPGTEEITRTYGPADSFSADRARVEEALYGRLNPQLTRERTNIEQRLADQGIRYGSAAYTAAMDDYNRQANDLRLGVTQTAGQEQQRLMDMAAQRAGFQNAAHQQAVAQAATRGQFRNAGLAQQFAQRAARLNAENAARNQYLTERYALRGQPINEVTALMSGSQVSRPSFGATPSNQIPTTDIAGLINQNFGQNLDIFRQQSANQNSLVGGILGLGGNIIRSDRRVKEDIDRMGTVFAAGDDGERKRLPIYEYAYKDDPTERRHIGPMAQDVEKIDRGAVHDIGGVKHIEPQRVMGSILRAA